MIFGSCIDAMEYIVKNPGLQHIMKTTLTFLDTSFRLVNQDCKKIVDDQIFLLKILSQLRDIPKDLIRNLQHASCELKKEIALHAP